jgi:hypothetical protein
MHLALFTVHNSRSHTRAKHQAPLPHLLPNSSAHSTHTRTNSLLEGINEADDSIHRLYPHTHTAARARYAPDYLAQVEVVMTQAPILSLHRMQIRDLCRDLKGTRPCPHVSCPSSYLS